MLDPATRKSTDGGEDIFDGLAGGVKSVEYNMLRYRSLREYVKKREYWRTQKVAHSFADSKHQFGDVILVDCAPTTTGPRRPYPARLVVESSLGSFVEHEARESPIAAVHDSRADDRAVEFRVSDDRFFDGGTPSRLNIQER